MDTVVKVKCASVFFIFLLEEQQQAEAGLVVGSSKASAVSKMTVTDAVNFVYFEMYFSQRDLLSPFEDLKQNYMNPATCWTTI